MSVAKPEICQTRTNTYEDDRVSSAEPDGPPAGPAGSRRDTCWVNLARACEILGVNESTVRRWADTEQIECLRTPGGHRRFAEADLLAMTEARDSQAGQDLEAAAVSRTRRQISTGQAQGDWLEGSEDSAAEQRDDLQQIGRQLVSLVDDYPLRRQRRAEIGEAVDTISRRYGDFLRERGTVLLQTVEAFIFFRRSLDETAKQLAKRNQMTAEETARAREQIAHLADRVLLGMTAAYDAD